MTATLTATPIRSRSSATPRRADRPVVAPAVYRRRRLVAGALLAVIVATGGTAAADVLAGPGGEPASAAAGQPTLQRISVVARPGDTLWSIAEQHHGDVSLRRYLDRLVTLNGGAAIQAGQTIILP